MTADFSTTMIEKQIAALPPITQHTQEDGQESVCVPVILAIPVDPLEGYTKEEAIEIAKERLANLPLHVTYGGIPLDAYAAVPLVSPEA